MFQQESLDSSVGRAGDCRGIVQTSLGHWFESGSRDNFFIIEFHNKLSLIGQKIHKLIKVIPRTGFEPVT